MQLFKRNRKLCFYSSVFDQASHRHKDGNGRLIVDQCVITKACVSPYRGAEIPEWEKLGLDPQASYNVLRPREELQKALPKFNGIFLLDKHEMDFADNPQKEHRVGTISNATMDGNNVLADLTIGDKSAIDLVEDEIKKDLSAGYTCEHVKEDGEFEGVPYLLKMKNIQPNHVALVERGRVRGATVFDENPNHHPQNGQFAPKGQGGSGGEERTNAGTIEITGKELGDYKDIKELRQKAVDYYKNNFQGKTVKHEKLGEVLFSGKGLRKFISSSANEDKLKMIICISDIIKHGKYQGEEKLSHKREDGIIKFHRLNHPINMAGKEYKTSVLVGEDEAGNKFYNLNPHAEGYTKDEVLQIPAVRWQVHKTSINSIANNTTKNKG